ncbi:MAG: NAD-dependent protein deacylase, partial [spirochete symbiont of Stewartia floridana]
RRKKLLSGYVRPNPAHRALARLEEQFPHPVAIVTQNIDNLHERGGSRRVIHMHGEILKGFCMFCREGFDIHGDLGVEDVCTRCSRPGGMRPDIVWFGEMPYRMEEICGLIQECVLFIAIGTSGNVYPAAGFVELAGQNGAHTLEVNLEPSSVKNSFNRHLYGTAGTTVPKLVNNILSGQYDFTRR